MNVAPLEPDAAGDLLPAPSQERAPFEAIVDAAGAALDRAEHAERAFADGRGGLIEMVVERASADVMLGLAVTAAQRTTQAVSTLLGMQV